MEPEDNIASPFYFNLEQIDSFVDSSKGTRGQTVGLYVNSNGRLYTSTLGIGQSPAEFEKVVDVIKGIASVLSAAYGEKITPKRQLKNELLIIAERYNQPKYTEQVERLKKIASQLDSTAFAAAATDEEQAVVIPEELFLRLRARLRLPPEEPITMDYLKMLHDDPKKLDDTKLQSDINHIVNTFGERFKGKTKVYGGKVGNWMIEKAKTKFVGKAFEILYDPLGQAVEPTLVYAVSAVTTPLTYVPYAGNWMQKTIEEVVVASFKKPLRKGTKLATELIGSKVGDSVNILGAKAFDSAKAKYEAKEADLKKQEITKLLINEGTITSSIQAFAEFVDPIFQQGADHLKIYQAYLEDLTTLMVDISAPFDNDPLNFTVSEILHDLDIIKTYGQQTLTPTGKAYGIRLGSEGFKITKRGAFQTKESFEEAVEHIRLVVRDAKKMYRNADDMTQKLLSLKYRLLAIAEAYDHNDYAISRGVLIELANSLVREDIEGKAGEEVVLELPEQLLLQLRAHLKPDQEITIELLKEIDANPEILNSPELQKKVHDIVTGLGKRIKEKTKIFGTKSLQWGLKTAKEIAIKEATNAIYDPLGKLVAPTMVWGVEALSAPVKAVPLLGPAIHKKISSKVEKVIKKGTNKITTKAVNAAEKKIKAGIDSIKKKDNAEDTAVKALRLDWDDLINRDEELQAREEALKELIIHFEKELTALFLEDPRKAGVYLQMAEKLARRLAPEANEPVRPSS